MNVAVVNGRAYLTFLNRLTMVLSFPPGANEKSGINFESCCGHRKQQKKEKRKLFSVVYAPSSSSFVKIINSILGVGGGGRRKFARQIEFHCLSEIASQTER